MLPTHGLILPLGECVEPFTESTFRVKDSRTRWVLAAHTVIPLHSPVPKPGSLPTAPTPSAPLHTLVLPWHPAQALHLPEASRCVSTMPPWLCKHHITGLFTLVIFAQVSVLEQC